jgi:hypothetical protein
MSEHMRTRAVDGESMPPREGHVVRRLRSPGWLWFAGTMTILLGMFNIVEGLVALFHRAYYVTTPYGLLVFDLRGWGWVHLLVGILAAAAGAALFTGAMWARVVTVLLLGVNALAQLAFMPAYPIWATIVIAIDIILIWAIIVHGDDAGQEEIW